MALAAGTRLGPYEIQSLIIRVAERFRSGQINIVTNWFEELKAKVPSQ